jgi:hypothetical protein
LESALRNLAISTVKAQLAVRRLEHESLIRRAKSAETSTSDRVTAFRRLAEIERETLGLEESLELLDHENRV